MWSEASVLLAAAASDFLIREGEIAGGAAALGGSIGLVLGTFAKDLGANIDPWQLVRAVLRSVLSSGLSGVFRSGFIGAKRRS